MQCDMRYKAVIFDMDGTILDTSEDLAAAINYALAKFGHRSDFPVDDVCLFFGSGAHTAVQRALAREAGMSREEILEIGSAVSGAVPGIDEDEVQRILEVYQPYYKAHNAIRTCAYPGIKKLLIRLREAGVLTAVVSNKPDKLFDLAIGETAGIARKPAPDMNYLILDKLGVSAEDAVYVGDTEIDIATAQNTGMDLIMVSWGFRPVSYQKALGAKTIVDSADETSLKSLISPAHCSLEAPAALL